MKKIIQLIIIAALLIVLIYVGRNKLEVYFFNQGGNYYNANSYEQAIRSFKNALKINPTNISTYYMLANTYNENNMLEKAIEEYKRIIIIDPSFIKAYQALANVYWDKQMYEEALLQLKEAKTINPNDQGIEELTKKISFVFIANSLNKSIDLFSSQDKDEAYNLLAKILKERPDFVYGRYTLASFYYNDRQFDAAIKESNEILRLDAQFWPALKLLGDIYFEKGLFELAVDKYERVLVFNEHDGFANNDLGLALVQLERYGEAIKYLQYALKLNPANNNIRYSLASAYRDKGMFKEAESGYKELARLQNDYPNLYNDLGDIYFQQHQKEKALSAYQKEIKNAQSNLLLKPNDQKILNNLAYALSGVGNYDDAKNIINNVIKNNPNYRQAYLTLAKICERSGMPAEALLALNKAKKLSKETNFIDRDIFRIKKFSGLSTASPFLGEDKIFLNNGNEIAGRIKYEDEKKVVLEVLIGKSRGELVFYRNAIKRIVNTTEKEIAK